MNLANSIETKCQSVPCGQVRFSRKVQRNGLALNLASTKNDSNTNLFDLQKSFYCYT